ncbi:MAG: hypothetical protein R2861_06105 [Desulfobacterales bacterium]
MSVSRPSSILNMIPGSEFFRTRHRHRCRALRKTNNIRLLKAHSNLQKHLKIGQGFVFFMSLPAANFLTRPPKIHDKSRAEILKNTSIFEDLYAFALYARSMVIFFKISKLYHEYGKIIDILLPQHENQR